MRERNTPGLVRVGAMEIAGISAVGMIETDTVGTAETSAEGTARIGDTGAAGEVVVGIYVCYNLWHLKGLYNQRNGHAK